MRKAALALSSAIIVGLMLAMPVSAGSATLVVADRSGDLGKMADYTTCEARNGWGDNAPVVKAGYCDILSMLFSYSKKTNTYTFGMELAASLPSEGTPLIPGVKVINWMTYIDPEPWNPAYGNNAPFLFAILLTYDEIGYSAVLLDGSYSLLATLPYSVLGSSFQVEFSGALIGNLVSFWWFPTVMVLWAESWTYWMVDALDPGAAPGQVWWDLQWPPA